MTKPYITFLQNMIPLGPWALVALDPPNGVNVCRTFSPGQEADVETFVEKYNGTTPIYYHVSTPKDSIRKKMTKEEVYHANALWVDIDPEKDENGVKLPGERERILARIEVLAKEDSGVPLPTCVVYSGGGYQCLWRINRWVINNNVALIDLIEGANRWLEGQYGGDHCGNIERILRLPGTINIKYEERPEAAIEAHLTDWNRVYDVSIFGNKPKAGDEPGASSKKIEVGDYDIQEIDDLMILQEKYDVSDNIIRLIATGAKEDSGEAVRTGHRSERLYEVVCYLVRKNVPREVIMGILLSDFEIAASVTEKPNPKRYAARQIARAEAEVEESWLGDMNSNYAVVRDFGGKVRVIYETTYTERDNRRVVRAVSTDEFQKQTAERVTILVPDNRSKEPRMKEVSVNKHKAWLDSPFRKEYDRAIFVPRELKDDRLFNMWRGFAFTPAPNDCDLYLRHLHDNVCGGRREYYDYLIRWMAKAVQEPWIIPQVAIVIQGETSTGKTFAVEEFGRLFGSHFVPLSTQKQLVGQFNAHLEQGVLVMADEAMFSDSRAAMDTLKALITADYLDIERKGLDRESGAGSYLHLMLCTERDDALNVSRNDRRFFMLEISSEHQRDRAYFGAIKAQLEAGGYAGLLYHLMNLDLSDFDVRHFPETEARIIAQQATMGPVAEFLLNRLIEGELLGEPWPDMVPSAAVYSEFNEWQRDNRDRIKAMTITAFSRGFTKALSLNGSKNVRFGRVVKKTFVLDDLRTTVERFNKRYGTDIPLDTDEDDIDSETF